MDYSEYTAIELLSGILENQNILIKDFSNLLSHIKYNCNLNLDLLSSNINADHVSGISSFDPQYLNNLSFGGGGTGAGITRFTLTKPIHENPLFLTLMYSTNLSTAKRSQAKLLLDTQYNPTDRNRVSVYVDNGNDGEWMKMPSTGFQSQFDNTPVSVDLSILELSNPIILYYCWHEQIDDTTRTMADNTLLVTGNSEISGVYTIYKNGIATNNSVNLYNRIWKHQSKTKYISTPTDDEGVWYFSESNTRTTKNNMFNSFILINQSDVIKSSDSNKNPENCSYNSNIKVTITDGSDAHIKSDWYSCVFPTSTEAEILNPNITSQ